MICPLWVSLCNAIFKFSFKIHIQSRQKRTSDSSWCNRANQIYLKLHIERSMTFSKHITIPWNICPVNMSKNKILHFLYSKYLLLLSLVEFQLLYSLLTWASIDSVYTTLSTKGMTHGWVTSQWNFAEFEVRDSVAVHLHWASANIITRIDVLLMVLIDMSTKNNTKEKLYNTDNKQDEVFGRKSMSIRTLNKLYKFLCAVKTIQVSQSVQVNNSVRLMLYSIEYREVWSLVHDFVELMYHGTTAVCSMHITHCTFKRIMNCGDEIVMDDVMVLHRHSWIKFGLYMSWYLHVWH